MAGEDLSSKAADLVRKALTLGVGAVFLTEESLRGLVSEFKLPKELIAGILDSANKSKNEFFQKLSQDIMERVKDKIDPKALLQELLEKNEIEITAKVRLTPKSPKPDASEMT